MASFFLNPALPLSHKNIVLSQADENKNILSRNTEEKYNDIVNESLIYKSCKHTCDISK
jgi:hypothetical protein